jgi:hypothetical protein
MSPFFQRIVRIACRIANPQISRAEAALNGPVTDRRERGNIQIQNFKGQIEYLDR